ncbi:MAG: competence/damage-inducible protein A [Nitriliruptorales bacterium]|nr:competence/damage-inducible protein A [Nitriliruptorales bacterium]
MTPGRRLLRWRGYPRRGGRRIRVLEASMLVIGNEILGGFVQDTNSGWLAGRLSHHGIPLGRIHTVPDEFEAIAEALHQELERSRPRMLVTSGGVGSTPDDITYEAVAQALALELVEEPTIAERIRAALDWTREKGVDVTEEFAWHMMRMARVPEGAEVLHHGSWAPGLRLDLDGGIDHDDGATLFVLPGVPPQFRSIIRDAIEPQIAGRNPPIETLEISHSFPESALNLCFVDVLEKYPEVELGSYPGVPMLVRLRGRPDEVEAAADEVRRYITELETDPAGERLAKAWADRFGGVETERR